MSRGTTRASHAKACLWPRGARGSRALRTAVCLWLLSVVADACAEAIVSRTSGYLNPCGCSKPQKGGIARRATVLRMLRDDGRKVVCMSSGGLVTGIGRQDEIKFQILMEALRHMGYRAVNVTPSELYLGDGHPPRLPTRGRVSYNHLRQSPVA